MKLIWLGLIAILIAPVGIALAQSNLGNPLNELDTLKNFQTMRASSSDPNWKNGNADSRHIATSEWLRKLDNRCITQTIHKLKGQAALAPARC
jgi:hypothetical protein